MKQIFLSIMLFIGITAMAQTNFSGTWELSKTKSKLNDQFSMAPITLVITQDAAVLKVERHAEFQGNSFTTTASYTLDGKESINDGWQDMKIKSTAKWSDDQKTVTIVSNIPMQDGNEMKIVNTYSMVDGGLVVTNKSSSDFGDMDENWVFEKK